MSAQRSGWTRAGRVLAVRGNGDLMGFPTLLTRVAAGLVLVGGALLCGCAADARRIDIEPARVVELPPVTADAKAAAVRRDPVGYLRQVAAKCSELDYYTLRFTRYERRGLLQLMYGPEHIACWFRRAPFSVRMLWLDESLKYGESTYVEGAADNKVRFTTRWWVPPLKPPPGVNKVDLQTPVIWGESKRPLTDFGLERLMERTLAALDEAGEDVIVTYLGLAQLPERAGTVHHLQLEYPATRQRTPVQELYIDIVSDLPVGTLLKLPSGALDAAYFYDDIDTSVTLGDEDFLLSAERGGPPAAGPSGE